MAEISCPYCNSRNCLKISYAYRGINKNKQKDIDFDKYRKKGTIYKNTKKCYEKYDFDGKKITARLYNRYCQDCLKEFHSMGKMAVIDIKIIQIIIGNEDSRVKLVIDLSDKNNATYIVKKDYLLYDKGILSENQKIEILASIRDNKINLWKGQYGKTFDFSKKYWILKLEYYNGLSELKSGDNEYPENWEQFIFAFEDLISIK